MHCHWQYESASNWDIEQGKKFESSKQTPNLLNAVVKNLH